MTGPGGGPQNLPEGADVPDHPDFHPDLPPAADDAGQDR